MIKLKTLFDQIDPYDLLYEIKNFNVNNNPKIQSITSDLFVQILKKWIHSFSLLFLILIFKMLFFYSRSLMIDPGQRPDAKELIDLIELVIIFIKQICILEVWS